MEGSCPASAGGGAWPGALVWKPWEVPGFPKAVGRQRRDVSAGGRQGVGYTAAQGVQRGGLLLALGTACTGSSAKSEV